MARMLEQVRLDLTIPEHDPYPLSQEALTVEDMTTDTHSIADIARLADTVLDDVASVRGIPLGQSREAEMARVDELVEAASRLAEATRNAISAENCWLVVVTDSDGDTWIATNPASADPLGRFNEATAELVATHLTSDGVVAIVAQCATIPLATITG
jgi:hypothetical protein